MSRFFTRSLAEMEPYVPGEQPKDRPYIKLNANENPYPPSPAVAAAVAKQVDQLRLYPQSESTGLCTAAAEYYAAQGIEGLCADNILCGNGSDENLMLAIRAFCDEQHPLAFADVTYSFYPVWCALLHVPTHILPLREDFSLAPQDYFGLDARGEVLVIANPNAPTGLALSAGEIEQIVQHNPDTVVIVDEAYIDFAPVGTSAVALTCRYPNLLVISTFSKSRSLAGARLGWCVGCKELIDDLKRIKYSLNPYNINRMTEAAGIAAMRDVAWRDESCRKVMEVRQKTAEALRSLGFTVLPSATNFLFCRYDSPDTATAAQLSSAVRERGVLIRHFDAPRIENWLRITVGTETEMQALLRALREILPASSDAPEQNCGVTV